MNSTVILDCTLRDGGYINNWKFGYDNIKDTIDNLVSAGIDMVEVGYLSSKGNFTQDESQYNSIEAIKKVLPENRGNTEMVVMINCGDYDADMIPEKDGTSVDGIRVCFHKSQVLEAIELCRKIQSKGYAVYFQPMVALSYSDSEYLRLIGMANKFKPDGFYMVDSHGSMKKTDVARFFYLIENNLDKDIAIGFHSHNNLQLSYSNAQYLASLPSSHRTIIDSSIMGMGRGAGNLNTELFTEYLNETEGARYSVAPILTTIDNTISQIYLESQWGYSLPSYLSAKYRCHQNYAKFLREKQTLTFEVMDRIFASIDPDKRDNFDREYVETVYTAVMSDKEGQNAKANLTELFSGRNIVIIAPGKTTAQSDEQKKIRKIIEENNSVVVSVNHQPEWIDVDYIFIGNMRRYEKYSDVINSNKLIITSNIDGDAKYTVNYEQLLNHVEGVQDNSALMLIVLLIRSNAASVSLAGVDGYTFKERNFAYGSMETYESEEIIASRNAGLRKAISDFSASMPIDFITKSLVGGRETDK